MERKDRIGRALALWTAVSAGAVAGGHARGAFVPTALDVNSIRYSMAREGYLSYSVLPTVGSVRAGQERTGWTDVRHPSRDTSRDTLRGYDYSDRNVKLATNKVTDPNGASTINAGRRRDDFDVTNASYASQAGLGMFSVANNAINGNDIVAGVGGNLEPSLSQLFGTGRNADGQVINQYYVDSIPGNRGYAMPTTYGQRGGYANSGNDTNPVPPGTPSFNNGFATGDNSANDTFAHELGHVLLDTNRYTTGDTFHSSAATDLMASGGTRTLPGLASKDGAGFGVRDPGLANGPLGTTSHFNEKVTSNTGTGAQLNTVRALNQSPWVNKFSNLGAADRADFNWVEDSYALEGAGGAADDTPGIDELYFHIGATLAFDSPGDKDKADWGQLNLPNFSGNGFYYVDVVSQILRYTDQDLAAGAFSFRASALDYLLEFSADGTSWLPGTVVNVFVEGWTTRSKADDYVARWQSPVEAQYVRIFADNTGGFDGNTQIDAVIAAIPEPTWAGLLAPAAAMAGRRGRRR